MSNKLPTSNYKKLSNKRIKKLQEIYSKIFTDLEIGNLIPDDGDVGYILHVDLTFPTEFYELYSKISICPIKMSIISSMLNETQRDLIKNKGQEENKFDVLVSCLDPILDYTTHFSILKTYASLGIKIKINSGFRFNQDNVLESHVKFCANKWKNCGNVLGEKRAKDNSNIVFGKTIECVSKRNCIKYFSCIKKLANFTLQNDVKKHQYHS